jgi:hypothetical protein
MEEMPKQFLASSFSSTNEARDNKISRKSFEDLNFDGLFGDVNLLNIPDMGYNVDISVNFEEETSKV